MYAAAFATNRYRESQDRGATPNQILMRLLQGAIGFVDSAVTSIEARDIEGKSHAIGRAIAIVDELANPFSINPSPDAASVNILRLYKFTREKLLEGSMRIDSKPLQDARKILVELEGMFTALIAQT